MSTPPFGQEPSDTGLSELPALLDAGRQQADAEERRRARDLRGLAVDHATLAGVLVDLAERGHPVVIRTIAGEIHRSWVVAVGEDVTGLAEEAGGHVLTWCRVDAIVSITDAVGEPTRVPGDRRPPPGGRLVEVVADLAAERASVAVTLIDGSVVAGRLDAAGPRVVVLRLDGDPPRTCYLASDRLASLRLRSG